MNHLCIGCGACVAACPRERIRMAFSAPYGCYIPSTDVQGCEEGCGSCERVCPFVPENPNTDDVTKRVFDQEPDIRHDDILGYYLQTFAGYSTEHRPTSSSGGLLTWMLEALLKGGEIDGAVCVGPDQASPTLFDFRICRSVEDIRSCSGSCYQPVEISRELRQILDSDGRYAVVALPCMARSLRLAMEEIPKLRTRIRFILGLVCGQMKSRHFVEHLSDKFTCREFPSSIFFRKKRMDKPANDFAFCFTLKDGHLDIGRKEGIARLWGERWFTLEACDYCDDVFCECADAAFMDAWLPEYTVDPGGHNLVIVREGMILDLLSRANDAGLILDQIDPEKIKLSQAGVIHQKRRLTAYRDIPVHSKRIPGLRTTQGKWRPDHALEAWMKSRIRRLTEYGVSGNAKSVSCFAVLLSSMWNTIKKSIEIAVHVRRVLKG